MFENARVTGCRSGPGAFLSLSISRVLIRLLLGAESWPSDIIFPHSASHQRGEVIRTDCAVIQTFRGDFARLVLPWLPAADRSALLWEISAAAGGHRGSTDRGGPSFNSAASKTMMELSGQTHRGNRRFSRLSHAGRKLNLFSTYLWGGRKILK